MIKSIHPTVQKDNSYYLSQSKQVSPIEKEDTLTSQKRKGGNALLYSLAGLAVLGATVYAGKKSMKSLPELLENRGVEIKNGIATLKSRGMEFTGTITRNTLPFGLEKETIVYMDGKISEILRYSHNGKERWGEFYIDGELVLNIGGACVGNGRTTYSMTKYKKNPLNAICCSCIAFDEKFSIFTQARKIVQETLRKMEPDKK